MVLRSGHGFARNELINEVCAIFGFNRTGAQLEASISSAIAHLLARGIVGEGSAGIRLRCVMSPDCETTSYAYRDGPSSRSHSAGSGTRGQSGVAFRSS
jgi:hypothetical protein